MIHGSNTGAAGVAETAAGYLRTGSTAGEGGRALARANAGYCPANSSSDGEHTVNKKPASEISPEQVFYLINKKIRMATASTVDHQKSMIQRKTKVRTLSYCL